MRTRGRLAVVLGVGTWSLVMLAVALETGVQHDYIHYLAQWQSILAGADPWGQDLGFAPNAYGPLHNALAPMAAIHPLLPKFLMVSAFLVMNGFVVARLMRTANVRRWWIAYAFLIPINTITLTVVALFGDNDTLVAGLVGGALLLRFDGRLALSGVLLGAAILLKFYPIVLLPFFCLDMRRWSVRPAMGALGMLVVGMVLSWLLWGDKILGPLVFGAERQATLLSPLAWLADLPNVGISLLSDAAVRYNSLIVLLVFALSIGFAFWRRLTWVEGASVALFLVLVAYKVGHPQFYLTWLVLLAGLLLGGGHGRRLIIVFAPFILMVEFLQLLFYLKDQGATLWAPLLDQAGALTGLFALMSVIGLMTWTRLAKR